MKNRIRKGAAALAAVSLMLSAFAVPVRAAAETEEKVLLPSGKPEKWIVQYLDEMAQSARGDGVADISDDGDSGMYAGGTGGSYAVLVFHGNETVARSIVGSINSAEGIPADDDSVYEWGSVSKTLIWVSAMQLWEQGILDLEADIRDCLPAGFLHNLRYDEPITMLNLMNHTGGWCETTYAFAQTDASKIRPLGQVLQETEPVQMYRPGELSSYSNWGAALAAYVIECVTGEDYCDYVHEHIFEPLGMAQTALRPDRSDNEWVRTQREKVNCYSSGVMFDKPLGKCLSYVEAYPAGAAAGTLDDLAHYAEALVDDSAPLFQSPETQQKLFSGSLFFADEPVFSYGFGINHGKSTFYGHDGATIGFNANMFFDPVSKYGYVAMTNVKSNPYLTYLPTAVFGDAPLDLYQPEGKPLEMDGYYAHVRSNLSGIMRYLSVLGTTDHLTAERDFPAHELRGNVYAADEMVAEVRLAADGSTVLNLPASARVEQRSFIPMVLLFTGYLIAAAASFFLLQIKRRLKKDHRLRTEKGAAVIRAGQIVKLISLLMIFLTPAFRSSYYGIPKTLGTAFGITQMLCAAVCAAAAVTSVVRLLTGEKGKLPMLRNIANIAGNAVTIGTVLCFQMYQFWNC